MSKKGEAVTDFLAVTVAMFICAYPTKWIVNYLFAPSALTAVFGVATFGYWKAFTLNLFCGLIGHRFSSSKETSND